MRLGVHFVNFTLPGGPAAIAPTLAATARAAEEGGCAWFSVMDHWFQMEDFGGAEEPMLEGYTSLGFVAGQTRTIDLGLLVTGVTYRHPGLLAKQATTLDVLSGGRAMLAIGAGWYEREHAGLGVPFPPVPERLERLEETLQICRQMWSDDDGPFDGKHYQLAATLCRPQPVSSPRPRILIGGGGERKTLRLVAQYADACNFFGDPPEVTHKLEVLRSHCEAVGRDPSEIEVTAMFRDFPPDTTSADLVRNAEAFAAAGVSTLVTGAVGPDPAGWLESTFAPVLDDLAAIEATAW